MVFGHRGGGSIPVGTGIAAGFQQRMDHNRRDRRQIAEAFQRFRQQNPHATLAEFQSFIDAQAGGSNYLRGGLPGEDILRSLAEDNQRRKQRDTFNERLQDIEARTATQAKLQSLADQELLGMDGDDYVTAYKNFRTRFGEDMSPLFEEMQLDSLFSPSRREQLIQDKTRELLPHVVELVRSSGGNISPDEVSRQLGVPAGVAAPIIERARQEVERADKDWVFQRREAIVTSAIRAAEIGGADAVRTTIEDLAAQQGITLSDAVIADLQAEAEERIATREEEKIRTRNDRVTDAKQRMREAVYSDPAYQAAVASGDQDTAVAIIETYLDDAPEDVREELMDPGYHQALYEGRIKALQLAQGNTVSAVRDQANAAIKERDSIYRERNLQAAELFGSADTVMGMAARNLAEIFDMSTEAVSILQEAWGPDAKGRTVGELVASGAEALKGMPTITDGRSQSRDQARMEHGYFGNPVTFDEWYDYMSTSATEFADGVENKLVEALQVTDPQERLSRLQHVLRLFKRGAVNIEREIDYRDQYAEGDGSWITIGTPRWDADRASSIRRPLDEIDQQLADAIERTKAEVTAGQQAEEAEQVDPNAPPMMPPEGSQQPPLLSGSSLMRDIVGTPEQQQFDMLMSEDFGGHPLLNAGKTLFDAATKPGDVFAAGRQQKAWLRDRREIIRNFLASAPPELAAQVLSLIEDGQLEEVERIIMSVNRGP